SSKSCRSSTVAAGEPAQDIVLITCASNSDPVCCERLFYADGRKRVNFILTRRREHALMRRVVARVAGRYGVSFIFSADRIQASYGRRRRGGGSNPRGGDHGIAFR